MGKKKRKGRFLYDTEQARVNVALGLEHARRDALTFHPVPSKTIDETAAIEDAKIIYQWLHDHLAVMTFYHVGVMLGRSSMEIEKQLKDLRENVTAENAEVSNNATAENAVVAE